MRYLGETLPEKSTGIIGRLCREVNRLRDAVRSLQPAKAPGLRMTQTAIGTARTLELRPTKKAVGEVSMMLVVGFFDDYWLCQDAESGERINVAKAWTHRVTPFDGRTIDYEDENGRVYSAQYEYFSSLRRDVAIGPVVERQWLIPTLKIDFDYIAAARCSQTLVAGCEWIDINNDGRSWSRL